jgi:hypothetical protein
MWFYNIFHVLAHCDLFVSTIYSTYYPLWPIWFYYIFHVLAHCGLSFSTIYSTYWRTVAYLFLQYISHISALWPICLNTIFHVVNALWPISFCNIFHVLAHSDLSGSTIYFTYHLTVVCLILQ